jgi:hypothetical protein
LIEYRSRRSLRAARTYSPFAWGTGIGCGLIFAIVIVIALLVFVALFLCGGASTFFHMTEPPEAESAFPP